MEDIIKNIRHFSIDGHSLSAGILRSLCLFTIQKKKYLNKGTQSIIILVLIWIIKEKKYYDGFDLIFALILHVFTFCFLLIYGVDIH